MNKQRFISLSVVSYIFLSGFLFEERGISLPAPEELTEDIKSESETNNFEFPLLKIIANTKPSNKNDRKTKENINLQILHSTKKPTSNHKSTISIRKGKNRVKKDQDISQTRKKQHPRLRKSRTNNKIIFNKHTSFKDIPLPLPKLSSLKLKSLIKSLPFIPTSKIPILNSILPEGSKVAKRRIRNHNKFNNSPTKKIFNHSKSVNYLLDMANIRIGKSNDYTTVIFDSYKWSGYNIKATEPADQSGVYEFIYEPESNRIVATIRGYNAFSALLGDQSELFNDNSMIKNMYIDRYLDGTGIKFIINLRKKVKISVTDIQDPARIILSLYPKK